MRIQASCALLVAMLVCQSWAKPGFFDGMASKAQEMMQQGAQMMQGGAGGPMEQMKVIFEQGKQQMEGFMKQAEQMGKETMDPQKWMQEMKTMMEQGVAQGTQGMEEVKSKFEEAVAKGMKPEEIKKDMEQMFQQAMQGMQG